MDVAAFLPAAYWGSIFMGFFCQRGSMYLSAAMSALMALTIVSESAIAQQERDRPSRGWRRNGDRPGGRRSEDRTPSQDESPRSGETARTTAPAPSANSFGTGSESDKMRKWASDTVAKYDKNSDKMLAGDELEGLSSYNRGADSNGDGKITVDELYQFSSKGSSATATTSTAKSPATAATATTAAPATSADPKKRIFTNVKRKSYRFKSTKDRLNNWRFSSRDVNGDGQVSMSEYSSAWTDRTAAEFKRYDKDNDGMITAAEAK